MNQKIYLASCIVNNLDTLLFSDIKEIQMGKHVRSSELDKLKH